MLVQSNSFGEHPVRDQTAAAEAHTAVRGSQPRTKVVNLDSRLGGPAGLRAGVRGCGLACGIERPSIILMPCLRSETDKIQLNTGIKKT